MGGGGPSSTWLSSTRWARMDAVGAAWTRWGGAPHRRGAAWTRRRGGGPSSTWLWSTRWGPSSTWPSSTRWGRVAAWGPLVHVAVVDEVGPRGRGGAPCRRGCRPRNGAAWTRLGPLVDEVVAARRRGSRQRGGPRGRGGAPSMTWLSSKRWGRVEVVRAEWTRWGPLDDVAVIGVAAPVDVGCR